MPEGFLFLPLGLVRLTTFRLSARVHARGRNGRVTQRCRNSADGKLRYRVRLTSRTGSTRRIWGIWKKSVSWVENKTPDEKGRLLGLAKARRIFALRAPREIGVRWKSQNRKNVYLSPYVEEPLNSKVIQSFIPELRSYKCFSCFEIPMFYVYMLWTFCVRFGKRWLAFACSPRPWAGVARNGGGADEKARIERMRISLLMSKNL